ncbi:metal dependent phosphohydrolase [Thermincola ferriacetica]|uniref:Metal dependent phosphohydrolase n=1 Tax=Thermincola ferriacetica TaxID=281456 RepID=A0A0L6W3G4_9FIRM|nr:HD domain-containing protein [Thermincola ferriacetica]KNZ70127.1 metal dependent phosphohydrolase [Thermincola ferriacetica]
MQLKLMYQGEKNGCRGNGDCDRPYCERDLLMCVVKALVRPRLIPLINRFFEVQELFKLADLISLGENQLHHVLRMAEFAEMIGEEILIELGIDKADLITAVLFHDIGKGPEIDDSFFEPQSVKKNKPPKNLKKHVPGWVEYKEPIHRHLVKSVRISETYNIKSGIIEAIALHHHVKIYPQVLKKIALALSLAPMICDDILCFRPEQYAAKGSNLAQAVAVLDQLCAIERKFQGKIYLLAEPEKMEDELVKELVIGVAGPEDPRLKLLNIKIRAGATVILLDLKCFGKFVQLHSEYEVQGTKREILNTIRSVVRVQDRKRERDVVGLVGGDEFVIITNVEDENIIRLIIKRITDAVKARTGFEFRVGYGMGGSIADNFHEARTRSNLEKKPKFVI